MAVKKVKVSTSWAFIIWAALLIGGYVFAGFKVDAPFGPYATWLTFGLGAYTGKRLFQKKPEFGGRK